MAFELSSRNSSDAIFKDILEKIDLGKDEAERALCSQYFDQLTSAGLQNVGCEPERLQNEKESLNQQTHELAMDNYRTFIKAAECSREVYKDFNIVEERLHSMLDNIPTMASETERFVQSSHDVTTRRKQNSLVLAKHTHLLEILEIPQLMDTCVRNSYFEEALDLSSYVRRLEKKYSNIPLVANIAAEVMTTTQDMLNQLLSQLRGSIQLPACLRVISYLRQLDVFSELELRIVFLQARDVWFQSVLKEIPTADAHQHIIKTIESHRVSLFDIITQYRAIFADEDVMETASPVASCSIIYSNILHAWISRKVSNFLQILQKDISGSNDGRLDSVFAACMYFGLSFSKIGCDFRSLVIPIFHAKIIKAFSSAIDMAKNGFEEAMETYNPMGITKLHQDDHHKWQKMTAQSSLHHAVPQILLDFPPLAHLTNGVLSALNALRQYPAVPLAFKVSKVLNTSLSAVSETLSTWCSLEAKSSVAGVESRAHSEISRVFVEDLLPFLEKCLHMMFHEDDLVKITGSGQNRKHKNKNMHYGIEVGKLTEHLHSFIQESTPVSSPVKTEHLPAAEAIDRPIDVTE